jgi:hypothetical protein
MKYITTGFKYVMKGASGTGMSLIIIANGMLHPSYIYPRMPVVNNQ